MRRHISSLRGRAALAAAIAALVVAPRAAFADAPAPALGAGGLTAPGKDLAPPPPPDETSPTSRELEKADREDSGRGLEILYFDVEGGYQYVGLDSLHTSSNGLVPSASTIKSSDTGPMFGVGAGLRLLFLTVGPRFRLGHFSNYDIWSLNGEVGLRLPLGNVEPHLEFGAGFTKLGKVSEAQASLASDAGVSIRGYDVRAGFGVDWYVTNVFSIGANVTGEAVFLTRPGVDVSTLTGGASGAVATCSSLPTQEQQAACEQAQAYKADGSSIGMLITPSVVLGLHF